MRVGCMLLLVLACFGWLVWDDKGAGDGNGMRMKMNIVDDLRLHNSPGN